MSVFNNKVMLRGFVQRIGRYDGGTYKIIFVKLAIFKNIKNELPVYEYINAQISCGVNAEGEPYTTSSHSKAIMNVDLFKKIDMNLTEGMQINVHGSLRGYDQVFLEGRWVNFRGMSLSDKTLYQSLSKNSLVTRNQTVIYIEEIALPNKSDFLNKKRELENQANIMNDIEKNQADLLKSDDDEPVDNDGIVVDAVVDINQYERAVPRKKLDNFVPFENMYFPEGDDEVIHIEYPF